MADKYDKALDLIIASVEPEHQPDARSIGELVADIMRGIEQAGADIDRIATALEKRNG